MFLRFRRHLSAFTFAAALVACGSDRATGPDYPPATLDQALNELSLPALSAASGAFFDTGADAPALLPSRCPYAAASQSFVCTPFSANGISIDQSFTLLTASGAKQSAFSAATTDAVRANTLISGTVNEAGSSLTIDGQQEITLSGLISGPHVLNGTSTTNINGTIADGTSSYPIDVSVTSTITDLVLPPNATPGTPIWPESGKIVVQASGSFEGFPAGTSKITITFTGSSTATVTVTTSGITRSCQVDLSKAEPVCGA